MYIEFNCFNDINLVNYHTKYHFNNISSPIEAHLPILNFTRYPIGAKLFTVNCTKTIYCEIN